MIVPMSSIQLAVVYNESTPAEGTGYTDPPHGEKVSKVPLL